MKTMYGICLIIWTFSLIPGLQIQAQTNGPATGTVVPVHSDGDGNHPSKSGFIDSPVVQTFILSVVALLGTGCVYLKRKLEKKNDEIGLKTNALKTSEAKLVQAHKAFERDMKSDVMVPVGAKKNSIMVIGIGGSGKSSIRNSICNPTLASFEEETKDYITDKLILKVNEKDYFFYVSDYRGQDFGTLISAFIKQQLQIYTPMRFGYINTLIIVVDLIDPKQHLGLDGKALRDKNGNLVPLEFDSFDEVRIREEHLKQWNRTALDAVFGLHSRESLSYVCLFINKLNFIRNVDAAMKKKILDEYAPLTNELDRRCHFLNEETKEVERYAEVDVFIGNAHELPAALTSQLIKFSVPDVKE